MPLVIAECFHFYRREQQPTESIQEYVADLHRLAIHRAFNANLDVKHFMTVWCVTKNNTAVQKHLLLEKDLTFTSAVELAKAMVSAENNASELKK